MNGAHLHLLLNHTPILGSLFGLLLLLVAVVRRQEVLINAGLITLIVAALLTIPTQLTGEGAEEVVEDRPGVTHALIHEHEAAAELSLWAMEATGALALVSLLARRRSAARAPLFTYLTLAGAVVSFGLLARTGNLGAQIMHPEVRPDFRAPTKSRAGDAE
ncbi:hypothetical protein [Hymenobacter psychrotolerans]|uniref:Uncharacterized protein n=1 Tax=Hymenobacter psychrotolerans DSM 18569 TaxID=1121959 RepID=A0A1M6Y013_9BACT|nr:hypothetical protein [Hymenobacter psychrotolerans]SHL11443.1 hypothetical protein SAMN02746009_02141 [Hymenobacter psychrotolerans DSM 18569]